MSRYAEGTTVPVERSRAELERLLRKHGATGFVSGWDETEKVDRLIFRKPDAAGVAAEKEYARRWRALVLVAKAKLEIIADGMSTLEREFLADMLLPSGQTLGEEMIPQLAKAYESGKMDTRLPLLGSGGAA